MWKDKYIQGHWDSMEESTRKEYLKQRTVQFQTRIVATSIILIFVVIFGYLAYRKHLEPLVRIESAPPTEDVCLKTFEKMYKRRISCMNSCQ